MRKLLLTIMFSLLGMNAKVSAQIPTFEWVKSFGGSGSEYCYDIALDDSGNIYATGYFSGTVDFDPGPGVVNRTSPGQSMFISKLDPMGNFIWVKAFHGVTYNAAASLIYDPSGSGSIYVTGIFSGTVDFDPSLGNYSLTSSGGSNDIFVCKFDTNGALIWGNKIGGNGFDGASSIDVDSEGDGDICITGSFTGTVDFDPSNSVSNLTSISTSNDLFICRFTASGNFIWAKQIGGFGSKGSRQIEFDIDGNIYIVGWFSDVVDFNPDPNLTYLLSPMNYDIFVLKLKSSGDFIWTKQIGGSGFDKGMSMCTNSVSNGDVIFSGNFQGTVDFDPGPTVFNLTSSGDYDVFVAKLTSDGNLLWAKALGGSSIDESFNVVLDNTGNVFTTGHFRGLSDFDPNPSAIFNLTSGLGEDIFISKLNTTGDFVWAKQAGGNGIDVGLSLEVNPAGNLFITGVSHSSTAVFDAISITNVNPSGSSDIFIAKINKYASLENDLVGEKPFVFYPNPANSKIFYNQPNYANQLNITIQDVKGKLMKSEVMHSNTIDIADLPNGIYFVRLEGENFNSVQRIVKQ